MRFDIYDTNGKMRSVTADITEDEMRCAVSKFKTHCAIDRSAYEYNHFVNWVKKNYGVTIKYLSDNAKRIDM